MRTQFSLRRLAASSLAITVLLHPTLADFVYRSRPDFVAPKLNITLASSDTSPSYIFIAPQHAAENSQPGKHGPFLPGAYIFDTNGELIWSGHGHINGNVQNFQKVRINGEDRIVAFEGNAPGPKHWFSTGTIRNFDNYLRELVPIYGIKKGTNTHHEFNVVEGGKTALSTNYVPRALNLEEFGGEKRQWILDNEFREFDLLTGKTLFEWSTADNIPPSVSYNELPGDRDEGTTSLNAWDYFHLNSIDKDSHGDYIISASEASSIFKISRESGDIIWTLGGKLNQFILGPGVAFSGQHHVRVLDNHPYYGLTDHEREAGITILSLFDNLGDMEAESAITRGKIIKLDIDSMTASLLTSFNQDDDTIIGYHGGSIQVLEEGGAFITYAETAQLRTFSHDGSITFAATIDPNAANFTGVILNYRGYIYPPYLFYSAEPIAAIAYYGEAFSDLQGARIFVSWNGDTATKYWRVWGYGAEGQGSKGYLVWWGHERQGFETKIAVEKNKWTSFVIEALDEEAQSLGKSEMIYLEDFVAEYKEPVVSEPETGVNDTKGEKSTRPASWRTPGELKA